MILTKDDVEKIKGIIDCHIDELENEHSYATNSIQETKQFRTEIFPKLDKIFENQNLREELDKLIERKKKEAELEGFNNPYVNGCLADLQKLQEKKEVIV